MNLIKFEEVLNDLVDYFILGDPYLLMEFKKKHNLPDDLIGEFTVSNTGDQVVEEGVMIPLARINNYPYTVYFNLTGETPELLKEGNSVQVKREGYKMQIANGAAYLYTIPYIRDFTDDKLANLVRNRTTKITLPNGWYKVTVLGGETKQETGMEPTFEFLITAVEEEPVYTADIMSQFTITASEY